MPWSVWLRYSPSQLLMQAGRSDLCSRHQHGSAGHSACFVIRVTQLCRIGQVRRRLARDAGPVALAAAHASSDLQLTNTTWMTRVLGHAAWVCVCQIASQQLKRPSPTPVAKSTRLELSVCNCVLSGVTLSAQARRGAVDRYVRRGNDGRCVRALGVSMSLQNEHRASCGSRWCLEREEREVLRDTGHHGCAPRLARLPRDISRVADRLSLVA